MGSSVDDAWALVACVVTCDDGCGGVRCLDRLQRPMSGGRGSTPGPGVRLTVLEAATTTSHPLLDLLFI